MTDAEACGWIREAINRLSDSATREGRLAAFDRAFGAFGNVKPKTAPRSAQAAEAARIFATLSSRIDPGEVRAYIRAMGIQGDGSEEFGRLWASVRERMNTLAHPRRAEILVAWGAAQDALGAVLPRDDYQSSLEPLAGRELPSAILALETCLQGFCERLDTMLEEVTPTTLRDLALARQGLAPLGQCHALLTATAAS